MSTSTPNFSAEHSGCGLPGRRRRIPATTTNGAEHGRSVSSAVVEHSAASPAIPATILRRWSVAELIARAAARPAEGIRTALMLDSDGRRA